MAKIADVMEELGSIVKCEPSPQPVSPDPRAVDKSKITQPSSSLYNPDGFNTPELKLKYNVCYIVAAVLFDGDKVLLIQEAKPSCRGDWYLPAGRMEPNETIIVSEGGVHVVNSILLIQEAAKREVEEESGLTFEPEAVIFVECQSCQWVRVTLAGMYNPTCYIATILHKMLQVK